MLDTFFYLNVVHDLDTLDDLDTVYDLDTVNKLDILHDCYATVQYTCEEDTLQDLDIMHVSGTIHDTDILRDSGTLARILDLHWILYVHDCEMRHNLDTLHDLIILP
jgi:hypothetical protein